MSKDPHEISAELAIREKERKEHQERLDALAIYVSPLPWFNIDLLTKLYINIFEKYFKNDLDDCGQDSFEIRSITCADFIRSSDVRRIDYNAFELDKNKRKILRKKIDSNKKVLLEIGRFMIAYSESNHHHFLSPKYREVLNIEGRIIIDPSSAASEISSHISKQLNQNLDGIKMAETAEYYLNIINKKSRDPGIKELKKYLEGKKEWAKGNKEKAMEKFTIMEDGSRSNMKTITVKLPKVVREAIQANLIKLNKEAIIDRVGRGICLISIDKRKIGNGILLKGGYLLTANHLIKSVDDANLTTVAFQNTSKGIGKGLEVNYDLEYELAPSRFFITMIHDNLDFTIVKIMDHPDSKLSRIPIPVLREEEVTPRENVLAMQFTSQRFFKSGEGSIIDISKARVFHDILLDLGGSGSPVFDKEGKILAMTVASNRLEGGTRVEAIRIDRIKAELNAIELDINNLEVQIKSSDLHCILVGNNEYQANDIYSLRGAINDASRMRHFIQSNLNYASLKFIQNGSKQEIIQEFNSLKNELKDGDTFLFYYAGYGGLEVGSFEKVTKFIATNDILANRKETNRLSHFELQYLFKQCFEKEIQIISILDCGYKVEENRPTNEITYYRSLPFELKKRNRNSLIYDDEFKPGQVWNHNLISIVVAEDNEDVLERVTGGLFMDRFLDIQASPNLERGSVNIFQFQREYSTYILDDLDAQQSIEIFTYPDNKLEDVLFKNQFLFGELLVERRIELAMKSDELNLSGIDLTQVPTLIHQMKNLRHLDLSHNRIEEGLSRLLVKENENIRWDRAMRRLNKILVLNVEDNPIVKIEELALLVIICKDVSYSEEHLDDNEKAFLKDLKLVVPELFKHKTLEDFEGFTKILDNVALTDDFERILQLIQGKHINVAQLQDLLGLVFKSYEAMSFKNRNDLLDMLLGRDPDEITQQSSEKKDDKIESINIKELKALVANNKIKKVLEQLVIIGENSTYDIKSSATDLQNVFDELESNNRLGLTTREDYHVFRNKLLTSIVELINSIDVVGNVSESQTSNDTVDWKTTSNGLENLIAEAKQDEALKRLWQLAEHLPEETQNTILVLQAQSSRLKSDQMLGMISNKNLHIERNRISLSVLELIKDLGSDEDPAANELMSLLNKLNEKQSEVEKLKKGPRFLRNKATRENLDSLEREKSELLKALNLNEEIQQENVRIAIKENKYDLAVSLLKESANDNIGHTATKGTIFISYASANRPFALNLAQKLRNAGANVWIDRLNIKPGDNWDNAIEEALDSSKTFLLIISKESVASQNVHDEMSIAMHAKKNVVPLLIEECDIPMRWQRLQHIDFTGNDPKATDALIAALRLADTLGKKLLELDLGLDSVGQEPAEASNAVIKGKTFISYSRDNREFAMKLAQNLIDAGADIWIDQLNIELGHNWDEAIQNALESSETFIIVLSKDSVASNNVMDEVGYALSENKKMVPVLMEDCDIPFRLQRLQYVDFTGDNQKATDALIAALHLDATTAEEFYELGILKKKETLFEEALVNFEKAIQLDPNNFDSYKEAGIVNRDLDNYHKAIDYFNKSLVGFEHTGNPDNIKIANLNHELGSAYFNLGDYEKALMYYDKALELYDESHEEDRSKKVECLQKIGDIYAELDNPERAIKYFEDALFIEIEIYGEDHPYMAGKYDSLSKAYGTIGEINEAKEYLEKASAIREKFNKEELSETSDEIQQNKTKETHSITKPYLQIGTLGHIDHGKTTLTAAIIKVLANARLSDARRFDSIDSTSGEKEKEINISGSNAEYETANRHYTHLDYPSHADYFKNMVTDTARIDGAILVVDATVGPVPQTREHILLSRKVGIPRIVVFMNKVDLIKDEELLELIEMEIRELLSSYNYDGDNGPVIAGSALGALNGEQKWVDTIMVLMEAVDSWIELPIRDIDKPFLMPVEDVFSITGRGTVATGRIETGVVNTGDAVDIIGMGAEILTFTVAGVEMFRKKVDRGEAGDNVGILLKGIEKSDVKRGMIICMPSSIKPHTKFEAEVYILKKEEGGRDTPIHNNYHPQFYVRTIDVTGTISLPDQVKMIMPGENQTIRVGLLQPIALNVGLRFAIRESGKTIGAGQVTKILD